jgi:plasmid maintenance system killer protein
MNRPPTQAEHWQRIRQPPDIPSSERIDVGAQFIAPSALGRLNASTVPKDMNLPGLQLHELQGTRRGVWSVSVSGNWRVTFRFVEKDVSDVNYEDYH